MLLQVASPPQGDSEGLSKIALLPLETVETTTLLGFLVLSTWQPPYQPLAHDR